MTALTKLDLSLNLVRTFPDAFHFPPNLKHFSIAKCKVCHTRCTLVASMCYSLPPACLPSLYPVSRPFFFCCLTPSRVQFSCLTRSIQVFESCWFSALFAEKFLLIPKR